MSTPRAFIMAAGTGGHIFPALAVAQRLVTHGWAITWLGTPGGMENELVGKHGFKMTHIDMKGVRKNGLLRKLATPFMLLRAIAQAFALLKQERPAVVAGFGGYVGFPGAVAAWLQGIPVVIHEQNAVAGLTNRLTARLAKIVLQAFPGAFVAGKNVFTVGNPVREAIANLPPPAERFAARTGPLHLLVVGGSLGAQALNDGVPAALALLPTATRPLTTHQAGAKQIDALNAAYAKANVAATLVPFIEDMASAYANADVVICRAGASTVSELAAAGVAAFFVPLPSAVDDHQTQNARYLTDADAGWLLPQSALNANDLAAALAQLDRTTLQTRAEKARTLGLASATETVVNHILHVARLATKGRA